MGVGSGKSSPRGGRGRSGIRQALALASCKVFKGARGVRSTPRDAAAARGVAAPITCELCALMLSQWRICLGTKVFRCIIRVLWCCLVGQNLCTVYSHLTRMTLTVFLDALASLDLKLSVSQ